MIDINSESLLSMTDASREFPGRPHVSTLWRYAQTGCRGVKLETIRCGGRRFTSREALERFTRAVTVAVDGPGVNIPTPTPRQADLRRAEEKLDRAGIHE